eukprot:GILJ01006102.1.p1 GENE.GILJ01006102.1~~GILJ01006102.1.p1  ORF type:complete len:171 (+),score=8.96 GILJ01006102.1:43-555(+)
MLRSLFGVTVGALSGAAVAGWAAEESIARSEKAPIIDFKDFKSFDEIVHHGRPVFIKASIPKCGKCIDEDKPFREASRELLGLVTFVEVNCQRTPDYCMKMKVASFPDLRVLHSSRESQLAVGANLPEGAIIQFTADSYGFSTVDEAVKLLKRYFYHDMLNPDAHAPQPE